MGDDILTDDYVAGLMAKEAHDCSLKYSSMGLDAYQSKPKAKPNTRFLRHIIRETKNHNEALLAKEAAEAQARLNELAAEEKEKKKRPRPAGEGEMRRRQLGDIAAILQGRKRKREGQEGDSAGARRSRRDDNRRTVSSAPESDEALKKESREKPKDGRHEQRRRRRDDRRRDDRSRSPPREKRHRQARDDTEHRHEGRHGRARETMDSSSNKRGRGGSEEDDDIGPRLPRGRGAASGPSAMDGRFSESYDPKTDLQPDSDSDWDSALEALRDRERWKQQGAERLRAAGFTEQQVGRWEAGEKSIRDVRWSKAGEGREWDRGKGGDL